MKSSLSLMMLLMLVIAWPCSAQTLPNENAPLTPDEIREGILRIEQGILSAKEAELLQRSIADRDSLSQRERDISARELGIEKQRTGVAEQKVEVEKARADFYQDAFKMVSAKTSGWCKAARIFTLGLAKCGRP